MPKQTCKGNPRCPALVEKGICAACKSAGWGYEATRADTPERALYDARWARYSRDRLIRFPLCEGLRLEPDGPVVVDTHEGRITAAVLTDHIRPHKGSRSLFWDARNHQSGCKACHDVKTARYDGGFGRSAKQRTS